MEGYVKIYRKIVDWEWYDDLPTFKLWIHLLLKVNHEDKKWRGIDVKRGSCVTSYGSLVSETRLSKKQIERALRNLVTTGEVEKVTTSKNTLIIITNYDKYQNMETQTESQERSKGEHEEKQRGTNKNDKNDKNSSYTPHQKIIEMYNETCKRLPKVVKATEERKKYIGARYKEYKQELSVFEELFQKANDSSFLCGNNKNNWKANFDWLINQQNMAKVLEGRYDDRKQEYDEEETTW